MSVCQRAEPGSATQTKGSGTSRMRKQRTRYLSTGSVGGSNVILQHPKLPASAAVADAPATLGQEYLWTDNAEAVRLPGSLGVEAQAMIDELEECPEMGP